MHSKQHERGVQCRATGIIGEIHTRKRKNVYSSVCFFAGEDAKRVQYTSVTQFRVMIFFIFFETDKDGLSCQPVETKTTEIMCGFEKRVGTKTAYASPSGVVEGRGGGETVIKYKRQSLWFVPILSIENWQYTKHEIKK